MKQLQFIGTPRLRDKEIYPHRRTSQDSIKSSNVILRPPITLRYVDRSTDYSHMNPLYLIKIDVIAAPVIQLRGAR